MFLGHFGLALAVKKAAPKTSLGALVLSAHDGLWPMLPDRYFGWGTIRR
jgi:hypothetical protein